MSKIIEIHRQFNRLELSQEDPEVKSWFGQSYRAIGSYYSGKVIATGLSFQEQKILMPGIVGMEPHERDFRKAVENEFVNINTKVPAVGLKLEIGLEDDGAPLSESNLPLNVKEFIIWRHAKGHGDVAINKAEADRSPLKRFYILDPNLVSEESVKINDLEDKALEMYFAHRDNEVKLDQILTMMGKNIRNMKKTEKVIELKRFTQKSGNLNEYDQKDQFNKFINICTDKDLESKFLIQELVGAQYLEKVGTAILVKESGEKLGDDMKEAVLFINNPKQSRLLNILKAQYDLKIKKGVFELKKVEDETKETV